MTVRISGFFRDAFPHVVAMLDDAVRLVADARRAGRRATTSRAHARADLAEHGDERRATTRIFGSKPGSYGAGILQVIESGNWRDDNDLAEVYTAWGGFAYGRGLDGAPAADDMRANYRRIKVAAKNIDTREHDIADSDDYFQYHGGMVATVRALTGVGPKAYVGDSTTPGRGPHPDAAGGDRRVFRARVVNPRWIVGDAAARLQGRVRAGGDRRLPVRLRRHRRRRARLDVRDAGRGVRPRRDQPGVHRPVEPVGAARHRRAAARGRRPRPVGRARPGDAGRDAAGLPGGRGRPRGPRRCADPSGSASSASAWARSTSRPRWPTRCARSTTCWPPTRARRRRRWTAGAAARRSSRRTPTARWTSSPCPIRERDRDRDLAPTAISARSADWHDARAAAYEEVLRKRGGTAAFLVWGDPSFYDSTIRIVEKIAAAGVPVEFDVLPGISAPQLLAARHRIVLHEVGRPVHITTGRLLREAVAAGQDNIVVMLNPRRSGSTSPGWTTGRSGGAPTSAPPARGWSPAGSATSSAQIDEARAQARAEAGWVMDIYLLRRRVTLRACCCWAGRRKPVRWPRDWSPTGST